MDKNFTEIYKMNSKDFWKNFWFYYKVHSIIGITALVLLISTIYGCVTRIDPDVNVIHLGKMPLMTTHPYEVSELLGSFAEDVDGDGHNTATFVNLNYGGENIQMTQTSITKFDIEMGEGDPSVALVSGELIERYVNMAVFTVIDDLVQQYNIAEDRILYDNEGHAIAVDISNTNFAEVVGVIPGSKVYAAIKFLPERKMGNKRFVKLYESTVRYYHKILEDTIILPKQ